MKQKKGQQRILPLTRPKKKSEKPEIHVQKLPQTKINVDVTQERDGQRDGREEKAHFAVQNKGFALNNESKKMP